MKTIFTITMIKHESARVVAWCHDYERAAYVVIENISDISEDGYYPYCVIEEIVGNCVYPCPPKNEHWFAWKSDIGAYAQIAKSDKLALACNFGIG